MATWEYRSAALRVRRAGEHQAQLASAERARDVSLEVTGFDPAGEVLSGFTRLLAAWDAAGWEMVTIFPLAFDGSDGSQLTAVFRRPAAPS